MDLSLIQLTLWRWTMDLGAAQRSYWDGRLCDCICPGTRHAQTATDIPLVPLLESHHDGQNDVRDEIFGLQDAYSTTKVCTSQFVDTLLSFWSINRDTSVFSQCFVCIKRKQTKHVDLLIIMSAYETSTPTPTCRIPSTPLLHRSTASMPISGMYNGLHWFFALRYYGTNAVNWPPVVHTAGTSMYNLGSMVDDATNSPSWGGLHSLSDSWYLSQIQQIRNFGGDVMISFGGPNDMAKNRTGHHKRIKLKTQYQNVIDCTLIWLDFNLKVHRSLPASSCGQYRSPWSPDCLPNLRITCTLPATPTGLSRMQFANVLAIPLIRGSHLTLLYTLCPHDHAVQAAYTQPSDWASYFSMGTTPVIGTEEYADATFSVNDANTWVTLW
ncbi:hypothetical protein BASA60_002231 [Batrachochytrium salamandrivorans]|nr:hypothetical protein BASA60_002231 [Batrachochytrium salamandrivorans]